jgi:hypothetical protein
VAVKYSALSLLYKYLPEAIMNKLVSSVLAISSLAIIAAPALATKAPVVASKIPATKCAVKTTKVSKKLVTKDNSVIGMKKAK